ncbi:glycosyltransferase family A protein [uncultured Microbacterium sp.]|uniref:glycosyltransferase family A protein n=1 Tax=uncultured Microbacterium sp. TaxID=191216 RepID=UPI0028D8AC44|nr:glycosyltransferase family A protein [uncultured Microbacterium sp.]
MPELSVDAEHLRTSVVIPVKDDAPLLARCLEALAAQTVPPDEVIVVDNGSTDDSAAMALAAGARVIPCPVPGIPAAASAGYDAARGALVLRLDADCVPAPTWVAEVRDAFSSAEQVAAFTGRAHFTDGPRALRAPLALLYLGTYAAMTGVALGHLPLFGSNLAFRRSAWDQVKGDVHREDAEVHDDLDLAFHLGDAFTIARLPGSSMGMSMRPLTQGAFGRRVRRGFRSVMMHWPEDFPPRRWRRVVARRRLVARHRRATLVRTSARIAA